MDFGKKLFKNRSRANQKGKALESEDKLQLALNKSHLDAPLFCYWKYPYAQWQEIIKNFPTEEVVIPFNWGFHTKTGEKIDFGQNKPETDLKSIANLSEEYNKRIMLLLPLSPLPLAANGGVPALLAKTYAVNGKEFIQCCVDDEGNLNKFFTFYDPRIIKGFASLVSQLKNYFLSSNINLPIIGGNFGSYYQEHFHQSIEDFSQAGFQESYHRYLKAHKMEDSDQNLNVFRYETTEMLKEFIKEEFGNLWKGAIEFNIQGASTYETLARASESFSLNDTVSNFFSSLTLNCFTSHSLLFPKERDYNVFDFFSSTRIKNCFVRSNVFHDVHQEEKKIELPLGLFRLLTNTISPSKSHWSEIGVADYLHKEFRWCYCFSSEIPFYDDEMQREILFARAQDLSDKQFNTLLRYFFEGGKIILDMSNASKEFQQKLHLFQLENDFNVEKINFKTNIEYISLGEGMLISFSGDKIKKLKFSESFEFWNKLISFFDLKRVHVDIEAGLEYFWTHSFPTLADLKFEEKRNIFVINSTGENKKVKLNFQDHFALLNIQDSFNNQVKKSPGDIQVTLKPDTYCEVSFGVYDL